jgi:hypothetical protein
VFSEFRMEALFLLYAVRRDAVFRLAILRRVALYAVERCFFVPASSAVPPAAAHREDPSNRFLSLLPHLRGIGSGET